jgi:hypothetical protein
MASNKGHKNEDAESPTNPNATPTEEQAKTVQRVLSCKPEDHYQILGVEENADANAILKAFQDVGMLTHGNYNKAAGSEDAFKHELNNYFDITKLH